MARYDFLKRLRVARNLFSHPHVETDSSAIDALSIQRNLVRAAIWLAPRSVEGFDVADFPELGPEKQKELEDAVQAFLSVAKQVPPTQPATQEQYQAAAAAFSKMLEILAPYIPTSYEGERVEEALRDVSFPEWVVNWDYELARDWEGIPAVYFNLYIDDESAPRKELGRFVIRASWQLRDALSKHGIELSPYIRVRTAAEHKVI